MRFRRGFYGLLSIVCVALATIEGCSLVTGYDGFTGVSATATCGPRIPANTAKPSGTAVDKGPLVGAAQTLRFFDEEGGLPPKLGLDLDENCSTRACEARAGAPRTLGVDNVLNDFIAQLYRERDISIPALSNGTIGLVVEVDGWNGTDNDNQVFVTLFNVAGLNGSTDGGAARANDGGDLYIRRADEVGSPPVSKPLFTSPQAYVSTKKLVAPFAQVRVRLMAPTQAGVVTFDLTLLDAAVVGTIALAKGGISIPDAQLVGRVRDVEMMRVLAQLGYCAGSGSYTAIKGDICGKIDLTDSKATDGKSLSCTSGSLAIALAISPAKLDTVTAPAPIGPFLCPMDPPDDCGR